MGVELSSFERLMYDSSKSESCLLSERRAMTITVEAVYENGILKPKEHLALVEGATVRLAINPLDDDHDPLDEVIGVCTEGPDISLAARHDEIIYGGLLRKGPQPP
jgi:predicted DNA-binding antitoxin AbrB/MazE fold protein